jgi:hypothetical protein
MQTQLADSLNQGVPKSVDMPGVGTLAIPVQSRRERRGAGQGAPYKLCCGYAACGEIVHECDPDAFGGQRYGRVRQADKCPDPRHVSAQEALDRIRVGTAVLEANNIDGCEVFRFERSETTERMPARNQCDERGSADDTRCKERMADFHSVTMHSPCPLVR